MIVPESLAVDWGAMGSHQLPQLSKSDCAAVKILWRDLCGLTNYKAISLKIPTARHPHSSAPARMGSGADLR